MIEQKQTAVDSIYVIVESSHEIVDSIQDIVWYDEAFTQYKKYKVDLDVTVELEHLKLQV